MSVSHGTFERAFSASVAMLYNKKTYGLEYAYDTKEASWSCMLLIKRDDNQVHWVVR